MKRSQNTSWFLKTGPYIGLSDDLFCVIIRDDQKIDNPLLMKKNDNKNGTIHFTSHTMYHVSIPSESQKIDQPCYLKHDTGFT